MVIYATASSGIIACMALALFGWQQVRWRRITIFLSYRVASDATFVEELYDALLARGLRVWWDKKCLKPGQKWEDGFADGLFGSTIFIPIVSKAALANFSSLTTDSRCDNVLLEHVLALELWRRRRLRGIFPVFVGSIADPHASNAVHNHFFQEGGFPACSAKINVRSVDEKAMEHLQRKQRASCLSAAEEFQVDNRSPCGVLNQLFAFQGAFFQGDHEESLDCTATLIYEMVCDVAAGKTIAEAKELEDGHALPRQLRSQPEGSVGSRWCKQIMAVAAALRRRLALSRGSTALDDSEDILKLTCTDDASMEGQSLPSDSSDALSKLFSPRLDAYDSQGLTEINPVLLQHAQDWQRHKAEERNKAQPAPGAKGAPKTGGLKRLLPEHRVLAEQALTPDVEVKKYLEEHHGIQAAAAPQMQQSANCKAALKLDIRRRSKFDEMRCREAQSNQLQWWRASVASPRGSKQDTHAAVESSQDGAKPRAGAQTLWSVAIAKMRHVSWRDHPDQALVERPRRRSARNDSRGHLDGMKPRCQHVSAKLVSNAEVGWHVEDESSASQRDEMEAQQVVDVEARIADMFAKQENARKQQEQVEEAERERLRAIPRCISMSHIRFAELKTLLVERGMPVENLSGCVDKFALKAAAQKWQQSSNNNGTDNAVELHLEWVD